MSPDQQLIAQILHQGQVQKPQSGSNHVSNPAAKLVSSRPHSPCRRVDVDVDFDYKGWNGIRQSVSHESIMDPSQSVFPVFSPNENLSESWSGNTLFSGLSKSWRSHSPHRSGGNFLQVPDKNPNLSPQLLTGRGDGCCRQNLSSSMNDLANASADSNPNLFDRRPFSSCSSE